MKGDNIMKKFLWALVVCVVALHQASAEPIRLGVADFVSRTSAADKETLRRVTEIFTEILSSSQNIEVTESKKLGALKAVNAQSAVEVGKNTGCDYVLLGAVMDGVGKTDYSNPWKPIIEFETALETRIIEVATGAMILSAPGKGSAKVAYSPRISMGSKAANSEVERLQNIINANREKSFTIAASMAAEKICSSLAEEYPQISSFRKSKAGKKSAGKKILGTLKINRGTSAGIQEGAFYRIYFDGEEVSDIGGESLGREKCTVAVAEVSEVRENSCTANITAGAMNTIRNGDKAEQITKEEAQSIADSNDFTRTRVTVNF